MSENKNESNYIVAEVASLINDTVRSQKGVQYSQNEHDFIIKVVRKALPELTNMFRHHLKVKELEASVKDWKTWGEEQEAKFNTAVEANGKLHEELKTFKRKIIDLEKEGMYLLEKLNAEKPTPSIPSEITIVHKLDEKQKEYWLGLNYIRSSAGTGNWKFANNITLASKVKKFFGVN